MFSSVLVIEFDANVHRVAVVKRGFRKYTVEQCHAITLEEVDKGTETTLPTIEELQQLLAKLGGKLPKKIIMIGRQGTLVDVAIPSIRAKKMRADQLKEMLRWEIEPYTGLAAPEILVGYEIKRKNVDNQHEVRVTSFSQANYQEVKELLFQLKMKLRRVYLPEFCFPLAAIFAQAEQQQWLMAVDIGRQNTRIALIEDKQVVDYRIVPLGYQAIKMFMDGLPDETLVETMREVLTWEVSGVPVTGRVICGPGAADQRVVEFFKKQLGLTVETVQFDTGAADSEPLGAEFATSYSGLHASPSLNKADSELLGAEFATVIGAGLRELGFNKAKHNVGIDDHIPLFKLISERVHFLPIAVGAGIVILFLGHYVYLVHQVQQVEAQITEQSGQLAAIQAASGRLTELQAQITHLDQEKALVERKMVVLGDGIAAKEQPAQLFLDTLFRKMPAEITLKTVIPLENNAGYTIVGESITVGSINALALILQNQPWCAYARVETITQSKSIKTIPPMRAGAWSTKIEVSSYQFVLRINFE